MPESIEELLNRKSQELSSKYNTDKEEPVISNITGVKSMADTDYAMRDEVSTQGFGESVYDDNGFLAEEVDTVDKLNERRAEEQGLLETAAIGTGRAVTKALAETAKLPGVAYGLGEWAATGFDMNDMEGALTNSWIENVEEAESYVKDEVMPVYIKESVKNGDIWDNLSDSEFWATEGADGVGFIASMFVPGMAIKGAKIGSKMSSLAAKSSKFLPNAGKIGEFTDDALATVANTYVESISEGREIFNDVLQKTGDKGKAGKAAANVFKGNLGVLAISNTIDRYTLFNGFGRATKKLASKSAKNIALDAGGRFAGGLAKEGLWEEGSQFSVSDYYKNKALLNKKDGSVGDDITGILETYLSSFDDVGFQKSIALGGILGGGMQVGGGIRNDLNENKSNVRKSKLVDNNNVNNYASVKDVAKTDENGIVYKEDGSLDIDPVKAEAFTQQQQDRVNDVQMMSQAAKAGSEEAFDLVKNTADFNALLPLLKENLPPASFEKAVREYAKAQTDNLKQMGVQDELLNDSEQSLIDKAPKYQQLYNDSVSAHKLTYKVKANDVNTGDQFESLILGNRITNGLNQTYLNDRINDINTKLTTNGVDLTQVEKTSDLTNQLDKLVKDNKLTSNKTENLKTEYKSLKKLEEDYNTSIELSKDLNNNKYLQEEYDKFEKDHAKINKKYDEGVKDAKLKEVPDGQFLENSKGEVYKVRQIGDKTILVARNGKDIIEAVKYEDIEDFSYVEDPSILDSQITDLAQRVIAGEQIISPEDLQLQANEGTRLEAKIIELTPATEGEIIKEAATANLNAFKTVTKEPEQTTENEVAKTSEVDDIEVSDPENIDNDYQFELKRLLDNVFTSTVKSHYSKDEEGNLNPDADGVSAYPSVHRMANFLANNDVYSGSYKVKYELDIPNTELKTSDEMIAKHKETYGEVGLPVYEVIGKDVNGVFTPIDKNGNAIETSDIGEQGLYTFLPIPDLEFQDKSLGYKYHYPEGSNKEDIDTIAQERLREFTEYRTKLIDALKEGRDVFANVTGKSNGVPIYDINQEYGGVNYNPVSDIIDDVDDLTTYISTDGIINFPDGTTVRSAKGVAYIKNSKDASVTFAKSRMLNETEAKTVVELLKTWAEGRSLKDGKIGSSSVSDNVFSEIQKLAYYTGDNLRDASIDTIVDNSINTNDNSKFYTPTQSELRTKQLPNIPGGYIQFGVRTISQLDQTELVNGNVVFNSALEEALLDGLTSRFHQVSNRLLQSKDSFKVPSGVKDGKVTYSKEYKYEDGGYNKYLLSKVLETSLVKPVDVKTNIKEDDSTIEKEVPRLQYKAQYLLVDTVSPFTTTASPEIPKDTTEPTVSSDKPSDSTILEEAEDLFGDGTGTNLDPLIEDLSNEMKAPSLSKAQKLDVKKANDWLESKLGYSNTVYVNKLINDRAWGLFNQSGITLSTFAENGVEYHEAYHMVSNTYLTEKQRNDTYNSWLSENEGKTLRTFDGQLKPSNEFTTKEIEEALAEEFREFTLTKENPNKNIRYYFNKMWNMIKKTLGLQSDSEYIDVFNKIDNGYYKFRQPITNIVQDEFEQIAMSGQSKRFTKKAIDSINYEFFTYIYEKGFNINQLKDLAVSAGDIYGHIIKRFGDYGNAQVAIHKNPKSTLEERDQAMNAIQSISYVIKDLKSSESNNLRELHEQDLKKYGVELTGTDEFIDEQDKGKDSAGNYWAQKSIEVSAKDSAAFEIKMILSVVPEAILSDSGKLSIVYNELGLPNAIDYNTAANTLFNKLSGSINEAEMKSRLVKLSKTHRMYNIVQKFFNFNINPSQLNTDQRLLKNKFFNTFNKYNNKYSILKIDQETGDMSILDATTLAQVRSTKNKWSNNVSNSMVIKDELLIYPESIIDKLKKIGIPETIDKQIAVLKPLGIKFTNFEGDFSEVKDKFNANEFGTKVRAIYNNVVSEKTTNLNVESGSEQSDNFADYEYIAKLEAATTIDAVENSHVTRDGNRVYNISQHTFLSSIISEINHYDTRAELLENNPHFNDYMVSNSLILSRGGKIYDKNGKKRVNSKDITTEAVEELSMFNTNDGATFETAPLADKNIMHYESVMNQMYPMLRASDNKMFRIFTLPKLHTGSINDGASQMVLYLKDELNKLYASRESKDNYQFEENLNNGVILDIIKKYGDSIVKNELYTLLADSALELSEINEFVDTYNKDSYIVNGKDVSLNESFRAYIGDQIDANKEMLTDSNAFTKTKTDDKVSYTYLGKTISESQFNDNVESFTINDMFGAIEQIKLLYGSPVYYKNVDNFFKRMSGPVGTKTTPNVSKVNNEWMIDNFDRKLDNKYKNPNNDAKVPAITTMTFQDLELPSKYLEEYKKVIGDKFAKKYYGKMNVGDGQGYITLDEYRDVHYRMGLWDDVQEALYDWEVNYAKADKDSRAELMKDKPKGVFNPVKWQYFGPLKDKAFIPGFYKLSLAPLLPSVIEDRDIQKLTDYMTDKTIGIAVFESANKVGSKVDNLGNVQNIFNDSFSIEALDNQLTQETYMKYWGEQLHIAQKVKHTVTTGTQMMKHIFADLLDNEGNFKSPKVQALAEEYLELNESRINLAKAKLVKDLDLTLNQDGIYETNDYSKLQNMLKDEYIKRDMPEADIESLNYISENGIDILPNRSKVESILYALADSRVVRQKRSGTMAVQVSVAMMQGAKKAYEKVTVDGKTFDSNDLGFYSNKDGIISKCEIYLPSYFKNKVELGEISNEKLLNLVGFRIPTQGLNSIESMVIKDFLPEESGNIIMLPNEIVAKAGSDFDIDKLNIYYPNYYNDARNKPVYIEHSENIEDQYISYAEISQNKLTNSLISKISKDSPIIKEIRSEVDKLKEAGQVELEDLQAVFEAKLSTAPLNMDELRAEYERVIREIDKIITEEGDIAKVMNQNDFTKAAVENRITEIQNELVTTPENFERLISPISADDLENAADDVASAKEGDPKDFKRVPNVPFNSVIEFNTAMNKAVEMLGAKQGVGISATQSAIQILFNSAGLKLKDSINVKIGKNVANIKTKINLPNNSDGTYVDLSSSLNVDKESIDDLLSQFVNAYVDAAKDPYIFTLNAGPVTANTFLYLLRAGTPLDTVTNFMNQPIVLEYLAELALTNSIAFKLNSPKDERIISKMDIQKNILKKYESRSSPVKEFSSKELRNMIVEDAKGKMSTKSKSKQVQILHDFIRYEASATEVRTLVQGLTFDTSPAKNTSELLQRNESLKNLEKSGNFINFDKLTGKGSFIYPYKEASKDLENMYNPFVYALKDDKLKGVLNKFVEMYNHPSINMALKDKIAVMEKIRNSFFDYIIQTNSNLGLTIEKDNLLKGDNSVPHRIKEAQTSGKYDTNLIVRNLVPILRKGESISNLKLRTNYFDALTIDQMVEDWKDLLNVDKELGEDLIKFVSLQSGIGYSPMSFMRFVPPKNFNDQINDSIDNIPQTSDYTEFMNKFFRANSADVRIIPKSKSDGLPYYKNKDGDIVLNEDWSFGIATGDEFGKLGVNEAYKDRSLSEIGSELSILPENKITKGVMHFNVEQDYIENSLTDEQLDTINSNLKSAKIEKVLTLDIYNSLTAEQQQKILECYG